MGLGSYGQLFLTCEEAIVEKSEASFKVDISDANTLEENYYIDNITVELTR